MDVSSKISMYDFLTMLVTGFLLLTLLTYPYSLEKCSILYFIACYVIGMIYHKVIELTIGRMTRNCKWMIKTAYEKIKAQHGKDIAIPAFSMTTYYESYYYLLKENALGNISVLEAQECFIRNIYPMVFIYTFSCKEILAIMAPLPFSTCQVSVFLSLLLLILPFVWYMIQLKIYKLIWEGRIFIEKIK